jgi:hypothetical protein
MVACGSWIGGAKLTLAGESASVKTCRSMFTPG